METAEALLVSGPTTLLHHPFPPLGIGAAGRGADAGQVVQVASRTSGNMRQELEDPPRSGAGGV